MTNDEMNEFYDRWHGAVLFEGVWDQVPGLAEAMDKWAKKAWPDHYAACNEDPDSDAVFKAGLLEGTIRDEQGPEEIAKFFNELPPKLQAEALVALNATPDE
jgi:hypothetical protein